MLYKLFRHPPYGHVIKLCVCGARRSPPARDFSYSHSDSVLAHKKYESVAAITFFLRP